MNQDYTETRLDNGLVIGLQRTPTKTIAGRLRVKHGSLHERPQQGLAHFLEHCIVHGGTKKYTPEEVDKKLQFFIGWNATTSNYETTFPVYMLSEYIEDYLDLASEVFFNPRLESRIVEEERQRLLREISEKKSSYYFEDTEMFYDKLIGDNVHNYRGLGDPNLVKNFTIDDLRVFHSKGYFANNMDLILVGDLPVNIEDLIKKYFSDKPIGEIRPLEIPALGPLKERTIIHIHDKQNYNHDSLEENVSKINIGFRVPDGFSEQAADLLILSNILGRDMHSRLMVELSRRRGLGYGVGSSYMGGSQKTKKGEKGYGFFEIFTTVPSLRANEAIEVIFDQLELLQREKITLEEIGRIKRILKGTYVGEQESNSGMISVIEQKIDYGLTPEIKMEKIYNVNQTSLLETAGLYIPKRDGKYVLMNHDPLLKDNGQDIS